MLIKDPEKRKQMETMINAMSENELIELLNGIDSEKNTPPERQHWKEINQQVGTYVKVRGKIKNDFMSFFRIRIFRINKIY